MIEIITLAFIVLMVYLNVISTIHLVGSNMYSTGQKGIQLALIWLIPIIGAVIVLAFLTEEPSAEKKVPGSFSSANASESGNMGGFGGGGGMGGFGGGGE